MDLMTMHESAREILITTIKQRIERLDIILSTNDVFEQQAKREMDYDESARLDNLNHQPVDANLYILAEQELAQLKTNLKWVKGDDAGMCEECGCDIPIKRLIAVPTTRKCVNCSAIYPSYLEMPVYSPPVFIQSRVAPPYRGQPCASSRLALNKNRRTLNPAFPGSLGIEE